MSRTIHDFELALLDPCLAMTMRGTQVDDVLRQQMIADLDAQRAPLIAQVLDRIVGRLDASTLPESKLRLFRPKEKKPALVVRCQAFGVVRAKWPTKAVLERYLRRRGGFWAVNLGSPPQMKTLLYDVLKLPKRMRNGKLTTDEDALKSLLAVDTHGVVRALLEYNKASTMQSILGRIAPGPDGRIRSSYNPAGTENGRFSSAGTFLVVSTNMQNMPKKEAAVDPRFNVRRCLVPSPGRVLIEADLSGAEAWVSAALAGDDALLDRMREGMDIHRWTASQIFHKPLDTITTEERVLGKMARHALNYGMGWKTFLDNVNSDADKTGVAITAAQAKAITTAYHKLHPQLQAWWDRVHEAVKASRRLTTTFGRTRTFFGRDWHTWLGQTHREAIAFEPQSTVADLLNRGLLRWWRSHDAALGSALIMQVHDSVVLDVPAGKRQLACRLLDHCLREPLTINGRTITIPVDVSWSATSWADMEKAA